jgi:hypothetical protein
MNRRMPNGTYGGVRGWGREAPAYSIAVLKSLRIMTFPVKTVSRFSTFNLAF